MKKLISSALLSVMAIPSFAIATDDRVFILEDSYVSCMSHDGTQLTGDVEDGSAIYYNIATKEAYYYNQCSAGKGYCIADNKWVVGADMRDSGRAIVMTGGKSFTPTVFDAFPTSDIHGITPDASRVCGVVGNPGPGVMNFPFYCDIDDDGNFGPVNILPTPEKDFFELHPQYCSAVWISDDGKTILGQVIDSKGIFVYPILYTEGADGTWTYSFPSQKLFNPKNLPLPTPVGDFEDEFPDIPYPELENFMTPEEYELFQEALFFWQENDMDPELDPYEMLDLFMTPEELAAYVSAVYTYNEAVEIYQVRLDEYLEQIYLIADDSVFFLRNGMSMSSDGKMMSMSAVISVDTDDSFVDYYVPYLFNLENGDIKKIGTNDISLVANVTLKEGTVIGTTPAPGMYTPDAAPPHSYIYLPSQDEFIPAEDFVSSLNAGYGQWMKDRLSGRVPIALDPITGELVYKEMIVSGRVAVADDFSVIAGGVDGYSLNEDMLFTYILEDVKNADVGEVAIDYPADGIYTVYNLQGVKVMETDDPTLIHKLQKGIYIVNGKKHFIN